jgi:hypothetical protein
MEKSVLADSVLILGRKLVEELGLEESTDTLGRWMAHHVADLITRTEKVPQDEKISVERECFSSILTLWKHRSELPSGKRPFEELEPVFRAVESLDPENDTPRYYRMTQPSKGEAADTSEQEKWLSLVDGLDHSAKVLIGYCLTEAAGAALDKSKEWVKLAAAIDGDSVPEIVIRFISTAADVNKELDPNEGVRSLLSDRIKRLREFLSIGETLANTLEERLQALPPTKDESLDEEQLVVAIPPSLPHELPNR